MKDELIQVLEENDFEQESNGKQTRYKKEYKTRNIRCELLVVPNKQPLLFYTIYYKDIMVYQKDIRTTINSCIDIIRGFCSIGKLL